MVMMAAAEAIFDFNPRPPHGGRQVRPRPNLHQILFQSTPSSRRATFLPCQCPSAGKFQSTPSSRRATANVTIPSKPSVFQSTPSSRRATRLRVPSRSRTEISIHALLTEGDVSVLLCEDREMGFQSTPSSRRATDGVLTLGGSYDISIHALLTEGDLCPHRSTETTVDFNPRPPHGGRPVITGPVAAAVANFNPRPPHGGRPAARALLFSPERISIHALLTEGDD